MRKKKQALRWKAYVREVSKLPSVIQACKDMGAFVNAELTGEFVDKLFRDAVAGYAVMKTVWYDVLPEKIQKQKGGKIMSLKERRERWFKVEHAPLTEFSKDELCMIDNVLNCWKWPPKLGAVPDGFYDMPNWVDGYRRFLKIPTKMDIISPIMREIESMVGHKAILRWHHIHNMKRTPEQFEEWWQNLLYERGGLV